MKNTMKRLIRDETGAAYVLTLVLLIVGGLIIAPVLGHMGTGIIAGEVHENMMDQLYAADAGVEDAIWMLQNSPPEDYPFSYPHDEGEPWLVNDNSLYVTIDREVIGGAGCHKEYRYQILSTSTGPDGSTTTVEAYLVVTYDSLDFSGLLDYALSSDGTITVQPNSEVYGDIYIKDPDDLENKGYHEGEVKDASQVSITWPTAEQLSAYYLKDVEHLDPYPQSIIDIKNDKTIGPLYRDGSLTIRNTGSAATLKLDGTIYVTGNLDFAQPGGGGAYTIDLNGQTIFVEGTIYFPPKFVSITGSGCIIAVGEIWFQPIMKSSSEDFVFVMSIDDQVWFNPNGDFTGAIAGEAHVQLQPNNYLSWMEWRDKTLNFPIGEDIDDSLLELSGLSIESWQIE